MSGAVTLTLVLSASSFTVSRGIQWCVVCGLQARLLVATH